MIPPLLLLTALLGNMQSAKEEGELFGESSKNQALSATEKACPDISFDPDQASENHEITQYLLSEEVQSNKEKINPNEHYIAQSEEITGNPDQHIEIASDSVIKTCHQSDAPFPKSVVRDLYVDVKFHPRLSKEVKYCRTHTRNKRFTKWKSATNTRNKWEEEFASDPTIKNYFVTASNNGRLHKHTVTASWTHVDDAETCNYYQTQLTEIHEPSWEEIRSEWIYSDDSIKKDPNCTYIHKECLDNTPFKIINGKKVERQCWKEKLTFLCKLPNPQDCPYIRDSNCELIEKQCLKEGPYGCSLWELTFKCYNQTIKMHAKDEEAFGMDEEALYEPNDSFSEVATKLSVFEAIKEDLEDSNTSHATHVRVFKGSMMECGKSIADNVMYDCCFNYSGLAKDLGLKSCSAEELTLAEMREQGLCHYVGSYEKKFIDLWKSRDQHVFCCFESKLARTLHEQARPQLGKSWGNPEYADCGGLSMNEISQLDFTKMDFSEVYKEDEATLPDDYQMKLESFGERMRQKMGGGK